jgi:CDP-glucose 4,6-dehydratase
LNTQLQLALSEILHEATLLNLSIEKAEFLLGWKPKWSFGETIAKTVSWYDQVHMGTTTPLEITRSQIAEYQRNSV